MDFYKQIKKRRKNAWLIVTGISEDVVSFSNPGTMLAPLEKTLEGGISEPRNALIQKCSH